jgi:actin-related protein
MEKIWDNTFKTILKVDPSEHNILITEVSMNPKENRAKMAEIIFEKFNAPGLYIVNPAELALFSTGKSTGTIVDSGEDITQVVCITEGSLNSRSMRKKEYGGRDVTEYLIKILERNDLSPSIARDIKEKTCYVALDLEKEKSNYKEMSYNMPDGTVINVKDQRFRAPEPLFYPEIMGKEIGSGIVQMTYDSTHLVNIDFREDLYENIILAGGSTMFSGLPEKLSEVLKSYYRNVDDVWRKMINVIAVPERKYSAWIGGANLSSTSTFSGKWITKDEYKEADVSIVYKKCLEG